MQRRVVVTGVGLVSSLGVGTQENWNALLSGQSGIRTISHFDPEGYASTIAGEVPDFDPLRFMPKKEVKKVDVFIQYALAASEFALQDAGLPTDGGLGVDVGVFIASGIGGFNTIEREHRALLNGGPRKVSPFFIPASIINLAAGQVSIRFGAKGPNSATCTACSASAHAIGDAFEIIRRGDAEAMVAGGSEAAITPLGVGGFAAMRALSTRNNEPERASRPFDRDRDGFIIGEGSGVLILEDLDRARTRGASIYCELVGYGMSADAHHMTAPAEDGAGAVRVMQNAIRQAEISPSAIQYVNAHGTSTPYNDRIETLALKQCFGDHASNLAVSSTKSMTGHLLGAAGGLEAGISALAIRHQRVPPTINLENSDPDCDLDYVANTQRALPINYALSNSFGFGGTNGCLVFKRHEA